MKKLKWRQKEQRHPTTVIITVSRVTITTTITIVGCVPGLQIEVRLLPELQLRGVIHKAPRRVDETGRGIRIRARANWRNFL